MSAAADPAGLADLDGVTGPASFPSTRPVRPLLGAAPRNPINRVRIETMMSRIVAGIGVLFALQSVPTLLTQLQHRHLPAAVIVAGIFALATLFMVLTSILQRGVRLAMTTMAVIFLLALLAWQPLMLDAQQVLIGTPWLWYLCTVATSAAAVAWSPISAAVYTVVAPAIFGLLRTLPSGGGASVLRASLDTIYAILLGFVVLVIIVLLRQAAAAVDDAQGRALGRYTAAVRQHARDVERVEVDSIVHDNVLATLLAAAGATTPQTAALAATMARQSIDRLGIAVLPVQEAEPVPLSKLQDRLGDILASIATPVTFVPAKNPRLILPAGVSEALFAATVQALINSIQHAAPARRPSSERANPDQPAVTDTQLQRTLRVQADAVGALTITVSDRGVGFSLADVPVGRLGLRVSILERVSAAGGLTRVRTRPGQGTTVTITWRAGADA